MRSPLSSALQRLFDHAALFPPTKLPMAEALAAHARLLDGADRHVVGAFMCPAARLAELDACVAGGSPRPPALGVIGYAGQRGWRRATATPGVVQAEAPLSAGLDAPAGRVVRYLEIATHGPVTPALDAVATTRGRVKVRCAGLTRDAVPAPAWLAEVLVGCAARGLVVKLTAGLGQPYRRVGPDGPRHGLVNVLAAAGLARGRAPVADVAGALSADESQARRLLSRVAGARTMVASIGVADLCASVDALRSRGLL